MIVALATQVSAGDGKGYFGDSKLTGVNSTVKFALHLVSHGTHTCTKNVLSITSFDQIVRDLDTWNPDPSTGGVDAFLVVFDYDSLSMVEYGLTWPSDWSTASTFVCVSGAISVGGIVNPGDGIAMAWNAEGTGCKIPTGHSGGNTAPFFVTSYTWLMPSTTVGGLIEFIPDPATNDMGVVECTFPEELRGFQSVSYVYDAGTLQVTDPPGHEPAVEPTTWGSIKSMFK
jgi:hypothetical protein